MKRKKTITRISCEHHRQHALLNYKQMKKNILVK